MPTITTASATRAPGLILTVAAAMGLGLAAGDARAQTTLRWRFQKGQTLHYVMDQKTATTAKVPGNQADLKSEFTQQMEMTWTVQEVLDGGSALMTQRIDRIQLTIEQPQGPKFRYDSKEGKDPEGPSNLGPVLKALVGAEFSFEMSETGEVREVKVPKSLLDAVKQGGGGVGSQFSEEGLKTLISKSTLTLPAAPVGSGKSWDKKVEVPAAPFGTMILDNRYTYEGSDANKEDVQRISVRTTIDLKPAEDAPLAVKIDEQDAQGGFSFDNRAGHLLESHAKQKLALSLTAQGMEISQKLETSTTMTLQPSAR